MNNSKIAIENLEEDKIDLEEQKGKLTQLVEAINRVEASDDWKKLKKIFLDELVPRLERQLIAEANKDEINQPKIYRLQGELKWAKKYADLKKLSEENRKQLENIKNYELHPRD